jgi:hypothetical protein
VTTAQDYAMVQQAAERVTAKPRDYLEDVERLARALMAADDGFEPFPVVTAAKAALRRALNARSA